jgi:hypothetical protein
MFSYRNYGTYRNKKILGKTNRLLSFDMTWTAKKTTPATIIRCRGNVFTELLPTKDRGIHRDPQTLLWWNTTAQKNDASNNSSIVAFVAAGTSLPSCYLPRIGGYTETHRLSFDETRPHRKMTRPTTLLLLHSLPRERLYRVVTYQG